MTPSPHSVKLNELIKENNELDFITYMLSRVVSDEFSTSGNG